MWACLHVEVHGTLARTYRSEGDANRVEMGNCIWHHPSHHNQGRASKATVILLLVIASITASLLSSVFLHSTHDNRSITSTNSVGIRLHMRATLAAAPAADYVQAARPPTLPPETSAESYPSLKTYALEHCVHFIRSYTDLLDFNLGPWNQAYSDPSATPSSGLGVYVLNNSFFVDKAFASEVHQSATFQTLFQHLQYLRKKVELPNLAFLAKAAGTSLHETGEDIAPVPFLTFCSRPDPEAILFPHFVQHVQDANRWSDNRVSMHNISSDVVASVNKVSQRDIVWLPGDCYRLASQLSLNDTIFKIDNAEVEWYFHLLRPFVHYLPITTGSTHNGFSDMLRWTKENSYAASVITQQANDFASFFLDQNGRECYALQLLYRLHKLGHGNFSLPASAVDISECDLLSSCPQLVRQ